MHAEMRCSCSVTSMYPDSGSNPNAPTKGSAAIRTAISTEGDVAGTGSTIVLDGSSAAGREEGRGAYTELLVWPEAVVSRVVRAAFS